MLPCSCLVGLKGEKSSDRMVHLSFQFSHPLRLLSDDQHFDLYQDILQMLFSRLPPLIHRRPHTLRHQQTVRPILATFTFCITLQLSLPSAEGCCAHSIS